MRRYIEHIKDTREPHERRQHALQVAGVVTAAVFVVWMGTLGVRFATPTIANEDGTQTVDPDSSLTAAAAASKANKGAYLEVSTSSVYSY